MGLLDLIKQRSEPVEQDKTAHRPKDTGSASPTHRESRQLPNKPGIPPVREPELPPGRAATIMACTKTGRAYWIVFKRNSQEEAGWEWERNLTAAPSTKKKHKKASANPTQIVKASTGAALQMGGRDWGGWSCPGCGTAQRVDPSGYVHFRLCPCGTKICLGSGVNGDGQQRCPHCHRDLSSLPGRVTQHLENVHKSGARSDQKPGLSQTNPDQLHGTPPGRLSS